MHRSFKRINRGKQVWNGNFFERILLKTLGLRIQLGHIPGKVCSQPQAAAGDNFVIIDSDGIHEVGLDFCGCETTSPLVSQLLRARLFPATTLQPRTAATFRVLETFQMLSHTAKVSGHEFMISLARRTNNTITADVKVCLCCALIWSCFHPFLSFRVAILSS